MLDFKGLCKLRFALRPCLHVSGFVCFRKHFIAVTKLYASTRIRIRCAFDSPHVCEFDTKMLEWLIEHALMKKLRRLPWQRSMCVSSFRTFTSSFSKVYGYKHPQSTCSWTRCVFKSFHSGERSGEWTKAGFVTKCLRIQTYLDTCGQGLTLYFITIESLG